MLGMNSVRTLLRDFGFKADVRTQCIILTGILTAVLPLEIHHLVAMVLGAAGYMFLQKLQPSVRRREVKVKKARYPDEKKLQPEMIPVNRPTKEVKKPSVVPVQVNRPTKEVKKPSVVPVQAPKFQATGFDAEVQELLQNIQVTDTVRAQVDLITQKVQNLLMPFQSTLKLDGYAMANPLGGTAFGVAVPDVEIVVTSNSQAGADAGKYQKSLIRTCTDRLVSGGFKFRRSAFRGSEPKVTLISPQLAVGQAGIPFNLSVNTVTPSRAQRLFEACSCCPGAAELLLLERRWAKDRGISHAAKGNLSPYCWMLLGIYYLQDVGVLEPGLGFLRSSSKPSTMSSAALLKGFMRFYAMFSWNKVVSLRDTRSKLAPRSVETLAAPVIEDPFESGNDLAISMHGQSLQRFVDELRRGHELCEKGASLAELLEPWVPPEEE